jgi:hypothetical protein
MAIRLGEWDSATAMLADGDAASLTDRADIPIADIPMLRAAQLRGLHGESGAQVDGVIDWIEAKLKDVSELQVEAAIQDLRGELAFARGEAEDAYRLSIGAFQIVAAPDSTALPRAARAAAWLGDLVALRETRELVDPLRGRVPAAWRLEIDATIAGLEGRRGEAISLFLAALQALRELGLEYERAAVAVSAVKILGPSVAELGAEIEGAEATLRRLGATPMLERLAEARAAGANANGGAAASAVSAPPPRRSVSPESRTSP